MINFINYKTPRARAVAAGFKPPFVVDTFENFYLRCGFSRETVADLFNISRSTVKRWEKNGAPNYAWLLVYTAAGYILDKAFAGHQVRNGRYYPNAKRTELLPSQFDAWQWGHALQKQNNADLRHELEQLKAALKKQYDENPPAPDQVINFNDYKKDR